jgi:hypothetical protein
MESVIAKRPAILLEQGQGRITYYAEYTVDGVKIPVEPVFAPERIVVLGQNMLANGRSIVYVVPRLFSSDPNVQGYAFTIRLISEERQGKEFTAVVEPLEAIYSAEETSPKVLLVEKNARNVVGLKELLKMPEIVVMRKTVADTLRLQPGDFFALIRTYGEPVKEIEDQV